MIETEISVIIVFRNEARHILSCIDSVINQFDCNEGWELILVDGNSYDNSVKLINDKLQNSKVCFRILENPGRILSKGWNIGIKNATGRFIIRPDAHAILEPGYIVKALSILKEMPDVGIVGGTLETRADSLSGNMIREALSMRSGVGNSSFRTGEKSGFKDTAVYGLYRKEVFEKAGLMNEKLVRHQDTEFHHRVLKLGYRIYMCSDIKAVYFCRDSFRALGKQMFDIGYNFSFLVEEKAADSLRFRHWIPMFFYLFLFGFLMMGIWFKLSIQFLLVIFVFYITVILFEALWKILKGGSLYSLASVYIIPFMHFNYAIGTMAGLVRLIVSKLR